MTHRSATRAKSCRTIRRAGGAGLAAYCHAAMTVVGMLLVTVSAHAAFELPEGERITHVGVVPRASPNKEEYELYDPKLGRNFDLSKFWIRGDLRVRPIWRNGVCFDSMIVGNGACNSPNPGGTANGREGTQDDARNHTAVQPPMAGVTATHWGVRAAYMLVRNLAGFQGLSMKAGRQYVVFGNQSLFGAFDWSNTGISHDGVMLQYSTQAWDTYAGWFRTSESDLGQAVQVGARDANIGPSTLSNGNANQDSDMLIFYNQIKSVPGFVIEPYTLLDCIHRQPSLCLNLRDTGNFGTRL